MSKIICPECMKVHHLEEGNICPDCGLSGEDVYDFENSEERLQREVDRVLKERKEAGLEGLVKGLEAVIINTEWDNQKDAVRELLRWTGLEFEKAFEDERFRTCVLKTEGSADFLVRARKEDENPFREYNTAPKSEHLPNTRLETFIFESTDIEEYHSIQKERGVSFLQDEVEQNENFSFVQTIPSSYTGNSIGLIEWKEERGDYMGDGAELLDWSFEKPDINYLENVKYLDHTAARVKARDRDAAIIEFLELTNYDFDFSIYVKTFNSITNVARLTEDDFAMVFTSGIRPFKSLEESGPTEKYIHNYNTRVHHMAFHTENIEETFEGLKEDDMDFLVELVGGPNEGLHQTFTESFDNTLLVNEYIHRYGDFDGFFTRNNVTKLTEATEKQ